MAGAFANFILSLALYKIRGLMAIVNNTRKTLQRSFRYLTTARRNIATLIASKSPVHVFHHIPKCGGTSIREILDSWFITACDYRSGWTLDYPEKIDLNAMRSTHCLYGHFETDGYYLHQRYPELFLSNRFKLFTFVRDPLQVQLSLFRYEREFDVSEAKNIEEHLLNYCDYIAHRFPATMDNYREIIDRYFFVGVFENGQASLDLLATIIGKPSKPLPWKNRTQITSLAEELSDEVVEQFRRNNTLDYLIYNYCVEKHRKMLAEKRVKLPELFSSQILRDR